MRVSVESQLASSFLREQDNKTPYKNGSGDRYSSRRQVRQNLASPDWVKQDVNMLFKTGNYLFSIPVKGKTDNYVVTIEIPDFLSTLDKFIQTGKFNVHTFTEALTNAMNTKKINVACSCFTGDTLIKLLDGRSIPISQLSEEFQAGKVNYIYSTDDKGDFVPSQVEWCRPTRQVTRLIVITLDNGRVIRCTPDHLFRLRTGDYLPAEELSVGTSLMPLYFKVNKEGYELYKRNSDNRWCSTYKKVAETYFPQQLIDTSRRASIDGSYDKLHYSVAIHHKDFVKENNNPENLEPLTALEHWYYHANCTHKGERSTFARTTDQGRANIMAHWNEMNKNPTPRMLEIRKIALQKGLELNNTPERKQQQSEVMRKAISSFWDSLSESERKAHAAKSVATRIKRGTISGWHQSEQTRQKHREASLRVQSSPEVKKRVLLGKIKSSLMRVIEAGKPLTQANYELFKTVGTPKDITRVFPGGIDEAVAFFQLNHKVACIEYVDLEVPEYVYDLRTTADTHNFLLDAGVVVHNCPDFLYRASYVQTVAGNNAGRPENRPAVMTNPQNRKGVCKHIIYALSEKAWIIKVASNLYQYVMNIYKTKRDLFDLIIRPALHDITDEQITGQPDPAKSVQQDATECLNNYYTGRQIYDDDQNFILAVAEETGSDISPYVTPENSPEQISEISILYSMNCPMQLLQALSNKDIDVRTLQLFNNILSKETERDINKLLSIASDNANKIFPKYIRYAILKDLNEINNFLEL